MLLGCIEYNALSSNPLRDTLYSAVEKKRYSFMALYGLYVSGKAQWIGSKEAQGELFMIYIRANKSQTIMSSLCLQN